MIIDIMFFMEIFSKNEMDLVLQRLAQEIVEQNGGAQALVIVGIKTRGVYLAQRIVKFIKTFAKVDVPLGELDINLYRDDLSEVASQPVFKSSNVTADLTQKTVVLVDDVLYTGRTIRVALNALIDLGHPAKIQLAVLIDRGHHQLPICADFIGKKVTTTLNDNVKVKVQEVDGVENTLLVELPVHE
jgi:pyrimidine operon attenuation protein/uracil phosphoribosyltransferase